eukprot:364815-Chlamydomonas_euryale.AAC.2
MFDYISSTTSKCAWVRAARLHTWHTRAGYTCPRPAFPFQHIPHRANPFCQQGGQANACAAPRTKMHPSWNRHVHRRERARAATSGLLARLLVHQHVHRRERARAAALAQRHRDKREHVVHLLHAARQQAKQVERVHHSLVDPDGLEQVPQAVVPWAAHLGRHRQVLAPDEVKAHLLAGFFGLLPGAHLLRTGGRTAHMQCADA